MGGGTSSGCRHLLLSRGEGSTRGRACWLRRAPLPTS